MRVALVLDRLVGARGGLESWAVRFAAWLLRRGYEVHAVAFEFDDQSMPSGLLRHALPRPAGRANRARALEARLEDLPSALVHDFGVGWKFDLLHVLGGSRRSAVRQGLRALPPGRRLRAWLDHLRSRRRSDVETRQYASRTGHVVAVSRMVKAQLIRDYGVDPARIDIVPNGVDTGEFSPAFRERHRDEARSRLELGAAPTFLFIGHNYYLKGLPNALRALARLAQAGKPACLCVVGNGPAETFVSLARRLGVASQVRFAGGVTDPRPYLAAADVLLHPAFYDACSLVVLEAWAMGVPAITSRWNGAHELWPADREGWIIDDPGNVDEITRAMQRALDPARRATAAAVGRGVAVTHSLEANFLRVEELYAQALGARGTPRP